MILFLILENWDEYDTRKKQQSEDPRIFNPSFPWEIEFLVSKIRNICNEVDQSEIINAILTVCKNPIALRHRPILVKSVLEQLCLWV
jgi:hypothetical protein